MSVSFPKTTLPGGKASEKEPPLKDDVNTRWSKETSRYPTVIKIQLPHEGKKRRPDSIASTSILITKEPLPT